MKNQLQLVNTKLKQLDKYQEELDSELKMDQFLKKLNLKKLGPNKNYTLYY